MKLRIDQRLSFKTPAKINFFLNILKKRDDGYHELFMDLIPINLFDHIVLSPAQNEGLHFKSNMREDDPNKNLIVRAVRSIEKKCNLSFDLNISLVKTVPIGAGLGGGSANAAGILHVLNHHFNLGIGKKDLHLMALELGADVPFFLAPRPSLARGVGETLEPIEDFPDHYMLLLYPDVKISTAKAYGNCTISGNKKGINDYSIHHLKSIKQPMNDFWKWASEKHPVLEDARERLTGSGAIMTSMSGSGSSVFGVYKDRATRDQAWTELSCGLHCEAYPFETLPQHRYKTTMLDPLSPINQGC